MCESAIPARITATPAAREAISRLRATRGGPVMFVQSGGCCADGEPEDFSLSAGDNLHFVTIPPPVQR